MMKKSLAVMCAVLLVFLFAACGRSGDDKESSNPEQPSGEESGESVENTESTESAPEESTPAEEPAEGTDAQAPEDGGASGGYEEGWSQEMEDLKAAVVEALDGDYWPDTAMLPDMLEMTFGLTADMYEDYMAEAPMISANVDTLLIVRAKDAGLSGGDHGQLCGLRAARRGYHPGCGGGRRSRSRHVPGNQ